MPSLEPVYCSPIWWFLLAQPLLTSALDRHIGSNRLPGSAYFTTQSHPHTGTRQGFFRRDPIAALRTKIPQLLPSDLVSLSHMTFKGLPVLASRDLCYLISSLVTFTHTVALKLQICYCPLGTLVLPTPVYAFVHVSLDKDTLPPSPQVQHYLSCNAQLKCSLSIKHFFISPATDNLSFP